MHSQTGLRRQTARNRPFHMHRYEREDVSTSDDNVNCVCFRNPLLVLFLFLTGYIGMVTVAIVISASNAHTKRRTAAKASVSQPLPPEFYRRHALQANLPNQSDTEISIGSQQYRYPLLVDMLDLVHRLKIKQTISVPWLHQPVDWFATNHNLCNLTNSLAHPLELLILIRSEAKHQGRRKVGLHLPQQSSQNRLAIVLWPMWWHMLQTKSVRYMALCSSQSISIVTKVQCSCL